MRNVFTIAIALAAASTTGMRSRATSKSDSNRDLLLVVNKGDRTLSIVDPESGSQLAAVPVLTGFDEVAVPCLRMGRPLGCPFMETLALAALEAMEERSVSWKLFGNVTTTLTES